ncbi:hypothetical protein E1301_Tti020126 [Triplophysa tibetana]|uniref:Uncharacterized protein n=1 Tax=Triplophysa tibetana TaxID=1572043 RepID=A0A5A9PHW7_9TELE|nr:hypothetical protein E1301_Tti020126 [Triplophysa tibetana]
MTNVQTEEDEKEDAPEAEGAQAEEFTQDLSDFQKEDGKEHTKKKDIVKYEECLKAKEGNKDSEKPKEFGQEKVKNLDSMEVKTVLKEKDGEKDDTFSQTHFHRHFMEVIGTAPLNKQGDPNVYYTETFISSLAAHFLSHAALWTSMMLGDLGRHGEGPPYQLFSKKFSKISKKKCQV